MQIFTIKKGLQVVCESVNTRNGFKHTAKLIVNGLDRDETKCCYLNRTWEAYTYQSVLQKLCEKAEWLSDAERKLFAKKIEKNWQEEDRKKNASTFKTIGMIAKMGEVFHAGDQKATNDWKERMIKAGLGDKGLIMPEDWNELSEDVKEARLNAAIEGLQKHD